MNVGAKRKQCLLIRDTGEVDNEAENKRTI